MLNINDLYDSQLGLFKSALQAPQAVDLTAPHSEYTLELAEDVQVIHDGSGLASGPVKVPVWGYRGKGVAFSSPGPILLSHINQPVAVTWKNNLPTASKNGQSIYPFTFFEPLPPNLKRKLATLKANIITHLHGAAIPSGSDGWPTESYGPGHRRTHHYSNQQPAATIWYHDHAMDQTGLNVYAGIAGGYVILDQTDQALSDYLASLGGNGPGWAEKFGHGPSGIPLVIQDRLLSDDASQYIYQTNFDDTKENNNHIKVGTGGEFFGRINLVNGQVSPKLEIGPTALRLKLLNGCNSRFLVLCFTDSSDQQVAVPVYHIGDDHGRRNHAQTMTGSLIRLGPGERLDVVVDFSRLSGQAIRLVDVGTAPFPGDSGELPASFDPQALLAKRKNLGGSDNYPEILLFDVANAPAGKGLDTNVVSRILATGNAAKTRVVALREFVMYMEPASMQDFVERCSTDDFNNANSHEPSAMLVLEELAPAAQGEPVVLESTVDLFDSNNQAGIYQYKVAGNTAGSLDSTYQNGVLRYIGDMEQAWLSHPYSVKANSTEVWRFINLTGDTHPMHIHLVGFQVVDSSVVKFTDLGDGIISNLEISSSQVAPNLPDHLLGAKDTVQVDPGPKDPLLRHGSILTLVGEFQGGAGRYVYHCHMLEHEDHMMMRKFKVI